MVFNDDLQNTRMFEQGMAYSFSSRTMGAFYQKALKPYGLMPIEWYVLSTVAEATAQGGIRVTDLATLFDVKTTYITAILNGLRSKDYVDTQLDAHDARVRRAIATKKANKELVRIDQHVRQELDHLLEGAINPKEYKTFSRVLQKLAALKHSD